MRIRTLIAALMIAASPAIAGDNLRTDGRFSIWTPDQWVVVPGKPQFEAHNPPSTIYVVATRIAGGAADATARARAFIEAELDEVVFKGSELSGTAEDEGDDVEFVARTVVDGPDLLIVLTYGEAAVLGQPGPRQALERVRASLKAQ